ncbi:hypothetical protein D3C81_1285980 [compost metagenome]
MACRSPCASAKSVIARVRRPLPSSNGCRVTNQKWAMPARSSGSRLVESRLLANQSRNSLSRASRPSRGGASKCTVGLSSRPEITCMGISSRNWPTSIALLKAPCASGNSHWCQVYRRCRVSGRSYPCVASSISSASPSLRALVGPCSSMPSRRAREERTEPTFNCSPSIAEEVTMFCSSVSRMFWHSLSASTLPILPSRRPCMSMQLRSIGAMASFCQVKRGQAGCCQIHKGLFMIRPMSRISRLFGSSCEPNNSAIRLIL